MRLALPLVGPPDAVEPPRGRCSLCGLANALDGWGDHAASCAGRWSASRRHDAVASTLATALRQAHVGVQENVGHLNVGNPLHRPADLLVTGLDDDPADRPWVVDVSVTNPTAPTFVRLAATGPGRAAWLRVQAKRNKYREVVTTPGYRFAVLVLESSGGVFQPTRTTAPPRLSPSSER